MIKEIDVERAATKLEEALLIYIQTTDYDDLLIIGKKILSDTDEVLILYEEALSNWNGDE